MAGGDAAADVHRRPLAIDKILQNLGLVICELLSICCEDLLQGSIIGLLAINL